MYVTYSTCCSSKHDSLLTIVTLGTSNMVYSQCYGTILLIMYIIGVCGLGIVVSLIQQLLWCYRFSKTLLHKCSYILCVYLAVVVIIVCMEVVNYIL